MKKSVNNNNTSNSLNDMIFYRYKSGFILKHKNIDDTKFSGERYLMSGFWNTNCDGWFFRRCVKKMLINRGAKLVSNSNKNQNLKLLIKYK